MSGTVFIFQKPTIPLYAKHCLTFEETAYYFDLALSVVKNIFEDTNKDNRLFVVNGKKVLVIKDAFEDYLIDNELLIYKSGKMIPTCERNEISQMGLYAPRPEMPWYKKPYLNIDEASEYFNIGRDKIRELAKMEEAATGSDFHGYILKSGNKTLIRKRRFEEFLDSVYQI